jgi:DNA-binding NarL/FixJ family response regulator
MTNAPISAATAQPASTPSPAQTPIGTLSMRSTVRWTASPAGIGEYLCTSSRGCSGSSSAAAVRIIAAGDALLAPTVTRRLISEFARLRPSPPARPDLLRELTPRETEVLRLVAEGLSNGEIAERLVVGEETVKTHVSRILTELGLRDRTQAVVTAYESGLVIPRSQQ